MNVLPTQRVNILLVDDEPANLLALEAILGQFGHRLVKACSGEQAQKLLLDDDYAVVILDVRMPGADGFETARLIRGRSDSTPIIFLSAYDADQQTLEQAYSLGAVDYLVKPLVPLIVQAKVAAFVELFRKSEEIKRQAELLRQSERRVFEERLAQENQRFARFMQHLPGLAWVKDLAGRYVFVNDSAEKAFGRPRSELYGRTDDEIFPPQTAAQFKENDARALASEAGVQVVETLHDASGVLRHSIVSKFPMMDVDGQTVMVGGMAIDVTDRLRAEEALKEADRLKDEFLAMLAHELRNPLAPIRNALHLMNQPETDAATAQQLREITQRQVLHMARLLDDLLDVSRISRGQIVLRSQPLDVTAIANRTVDAIRPFLESRNHKLTVSFAADSLRVHGDPHRLEQILTNLLNNAAKYTDPGGRIWLVIERQNGQVVMRVKDTGIGIVPAMLPRIFDLFVQAERRLDRSQGGVGVGLTLVKKLVELHGGTVELHSPGPGRGSEFVVRLPALAVAEGQPDTPGNDFDRQTARLPRRRILVVDDNHDAAATLAMLLKLSGQDVETANDGPSALELADRFRPELVLLDIGMPGMDGYEVARRLQERPEHHEAILVAITGWGQEEDHKRSKAAGFDYHFVKPVEPKTLQKLLADFG